VGRVRPEKGTDLFVDVMVQLLPKLPDYRAVIIGKTTAEFRAFREGLEAKIMSAGLSDRIIFADEIPAAQMPAIVAAATLLFALPRYEGYGLTVLEAMASGTPVIASDAGEFRKFVGASKAGVIVAGEIVKQATAAALASVADFEAYAAAAQVARARAKLFSAANECDALEQVYNTMTKQNA
jgi:mannosyltransferase